MKVRLGEGIRAGWLTLVVLSGITGFSYLAAQLVDWQLLPLARFNPGSLPAELLECGVIALVSGVLMWPLVLRPREAALRADRNTQEFHARLHRALEMADSEDGAYAVAARGMESILPDLTAQLMLADSSEAHLKTAMERTPNAGLPGCGVVAPHSCPAIRKGQTMVYPDNRQLDACPMLFDRLERSASAVCVPVSTIGRSIGVLHVPCRSDQQPDRRTVGMVEAVAEQVGARIGTLRVMEQTHLQAATDPLTGLLNRRSFENQAQELMRGSVPFALAMVDLDHFKRLNDTHGHDAGDRALRQFARIMRTVLRAEDIVSRFGGEEFVVVLPGLGAEAAKAVLQRVQEQLLLTVASGTMPAFTVTFGLARSDDATSLEELVRLADAALFRGKREGRNRIVIHTDLPMPQPSPAEHATSERPA